MTQPRAAFSAFLQGFDAPALGVAVSGGGDSIALLRLAAQAGVPLYAVTVDHGLRPEAAHEAAFVAQLCADLGVSHDTLRWTDWDGTGNLQDQARQARYRLMSDWAAQHGLTQIALAHTEEDQAETFLMRLARRAGVDGLSAMQDRQVGRVRFVRPLLCCRRADLRSYLKDLDQDWIEDPSNRNLTFERVRMRQGAQALSGLGLTPGALSEVSQTLTQAREALNWAVHQFAQKHLHMQGPDVKIDRAAFVKLPSELQRRLLVGVLRWMSGADYAPRRQPVMQLQQAVAEKQRMTLHGCVLTHRQGALYLHREFAAVADKTEEPGQAWDGRYVLLGPETPRAQVAAVGENGLSTLNWRQTGRPAAAVMADPGVWVGSRLIAAPLSGFANGWGVEPANDRQDCLSALLSH